MLVNKLQLFIINFYQFILLINQIYLGVIIILQLFMIFLINNSIFTNYNSLVNNLQQVLNFKYYFNFELIILGGLIFSSKLWLINIIFQNLNQVIYIFFISINNFNLINSVNFFSLKFNILNNFFILDNQQQFQLQLIDLQNLIFIMIILGIVLVGIIINLL